MIEMKNSLEDFSLTGQVAKNLRSDILNGAIKGGERLIENQLKNRFGISRTPLREAFRVLEREGLIEIIPRRGAFVRTISINDIRENFPVRAMLEGLAARLACAHITSHDILEMEKAFNMMKKAAKEKDFFKFERHHFYSHEIFINASKNTTLINVLKSLRMHTLWHRYTYQYYKKVHRKSLKYHREIIDLYKAEKPSAKRIEKIVREHIEIATEPFLAAMKKLESN